jgi:MFS transporter, DHA2 family, glioxin efflux transporter
VATAIPKITDEFHGLDKVSWYGSAFFMTNGGFQSLWGKAYKYFALKTTFIISIFVFMLGSLICGVAPNASTLIVGRAFNGLGASGLGTGAYTIIAFITELHKRPLFISIIGISYDIASVVGPIMGGAFADKISWRWCFYINLPIGGVAALIVFILFHTPDGAKPVPASWKEKLLQMDPIGVVMIMGATVAYLLALQNGGQSIPWKSNEVIGLLIGFVVILIVFCVWERFQGERAIIIPRLVKQRAIGVSCIYCFFFCGSYFLIIYFLPIYFQSVDNISAALSGVHNLPLILAFTISMILSGVFISSTGLTFPAMVCGAAIATVAAGLLYTLNVNINTGSWIGYQILAGIGWGIGFQLPMNVSQGNAAPEDMSSITALILCK